MYGSLKKLYSEFSPQEKRILLFLLVVVIITALLQVIGVASIFPFIAVATDPASIDKNQYLKLLKTFLMLNEREFIISLGGLVLFSLILTNVFLAFSQWLTSKFLATTVHNLTNKMFQRYLYEKYEFHLQRNSAELIKNLTSEVGRVVNGGIMSSINVISGCITTLFILTLLFIVNPYIAMSVCGVLGGAYALVYWAIKVKMAWIGVETTRLMSLRMRYYSEALGGIKELSVLGREKLYIDSFVTVSEDLVKYKVYSAAVMDLPRYLIEIISFGGIIAITIYLVAIQGDTKTALPMIALYGLAAYRLMPALQGMFKSFATIKHDIAAVDLFYDDLNNSVKPLYKHIGLKKMNKSHFEFKYQLLLKNINYKYVGASKKAVKQLTLQIKPKTSIGIVGSSGSGKSTLVDIMLGLLEPQEGELIVDGTILTEEGMRAWRNNIGYVPQVIFLADSSISENIAFGIPANEINQNSVEIAAKTAELHDFIVNELEGSYAAIVGERGVRLSGGQRQRIGIARALYHNPDILILDEATSALDSPTEQSIIRAVYKLAHEKTIIMIAHRLSTIKSCDEIIIMESGEIVDQGNYDDLSEGSASFRKLLLKQREGSS